MVDGSDAVESHADRAVQGSLAVGLLAAFVFQQPWVVPVLTVLVAFGAVFGPAGNPFLRLYAWLVAPRRRRRRSRDYEEASSVRAQDVLATVLLGTATLVLALGIGPIAWVVALAQAGAAAVAATTGVHLGELALARLRRRG